MRPSVVDTTVLSNFAHAQRPDLLHLLFGSTIITTPTVMAELNVGEDRKLVPVCDWGWLPVHDLTSEKAELAAKLRQQLDADEAECLAVAHVRNLTFLSDDFAARRMASQGGVKVSGTLGVLLILVQYGHLTLADSDDLLHAFVAHGYRSPVQSLRDVQIERDMQ